MAEEPPNEGDDERVQINVTMKQRTIDRLRVMFPVALDDSERVRSAVQESIEREESSEYMIRRSSE